jgi:tRNA-specific 2-thiouridylase
VIVAAPFHWIRRPPLEQPLALRGRIRHRQALQECTVRSCDDGIEARFASPQRAAAPGQYLVLYDGEECLGGGEIVPA